MDLILWRHAQAEDLPAGPMHAPDVPSASVGMSGDADLARRLTSRGERQAERMAAWLNQRLTASTKVLVSPAQRTQQTAQALGRPFKIVPTMAPGASVDDVLQAARWPASREPVVIVGHQPVLGMLAARLLTGQDLLWSVKKGGVWWLRGREREGALQITLQAVQSPEFL